MKKYRFYKDELGWFIDIKWFPFNRGYLAMVAGADKLLDIISEGKSEIVLQVSKSPIPYWDGALEKFSSLGLSGGAFYKPREGYTKLNEEGYSTLNDQIIKANIKDVWLCPVTLWVFRKYPAKIYYKIVK